jgi:hypothetical protein
MLRTRRTRLTDREAAMKTNALFGQIEAETKVLEAIARQYEPTSREYQALRHAALSLAYIVMNERSEFASFVETIDDELSDEQRKDLRERYGIET